MNEIEKAYLEGVADAHNMGKGFSPSAGWMGSEAKRQADRYEELLSGWKDRAELLRDVAQRSFDDGRDGEAMSLQTVAAIYEVVVQQLEGISGE